MSAGWELTVAALSQQLHAGCRLNELLPLKFCEHKDSLVHMKFLILSVLIHHDGAMCRTRQAAITTELTEIVSGAAALEG